MRPLLASHPSLQIKTMPLIRIATILVALAPLGILILTWDRLSARSVILLGGMLLLLLVLLVLAQSTITISPTGVRLVTVFRRLRLDWAEMTQIAITPRGHRIAFMGENKHLVIQITLADRRQKDLPAVLAQYAQAHAIPLIHTTALPTTQRNVREP